MNYRKVGLWAVVIFVTVAFGSILYLRWLENLYSQPPNQVYLPTMLVMTPTVVPTPDPTPTPTPLVLPVSGWKFADFSGEKTYENGYEYSWGIFENDNGSKVKAMCSAPGSPAPNVGDYYIWNKEINILIPVLDNQDGNIQRFWYPTIQ